MIGEPELEGEWDTHRTPTAAEEPGFPRERVGGPRRAWLWALGGAVVASAVWAGFLVAQDRFSSDGPRIAYRHVEDLCEGRPMAALAKTEVKPGSGLPGHGEHPALDWSYCTYHGEYTEKEAVYYQVQVLVELHKKTDPRAEFGTGAGTGRDLFAGVDGPAEQVSGLPGRAEFHSMAGGGRHRLQVLDGGAVFTLHVQWFGPGAGSEPDTDAIKAAMVEDMRALMASLRK
ncbi:hypothetical protein K7B10_15970 [Streptomyces flavotricini]|uniref:DUF3558 domain-containing protein n=1 Tax=Streptomyces flavotricini TaxID=66888 RepID=A0ABS8E5J0_9ACTN|nr:hypothetical protein [Streptomyces flavotricini]MCC0096256.1 hypothetical protein [Streptomyces flavotricini]